MVILVGGERGGIADVDGCDGSVVRCFFLLHIYKSKQT
jgi:hypothetical protein